MYTCHLAANHPVNKKIDPDAHLKPKKHEVSMAGFRLFIKQFWEGIEEH